MLDATRPYLLQEELRKKLLDETGGAPAELMQQAQQQAMGQVDPGAPAPAAPAATPAAAPAPAPAPQAPVYPDDLSDAAMAKAYTAKRGAETMGQMMNAASVINHGFGGSAPLNAGDAFVRGADDKVNEIASRRAGLGQEQKVRDEQHAREMQRTAEDPNSATNQLRASLLGRFYKDDPQVQPFLSKLNPAQEPSLEHMMGLDVAKTKALKTNGAGGLTPEGRTAIVEQLTAMAPSMGWSQDQLHANILVAMQAPEKYVQASFSTMPNTVKKTDVQQSEGGKNRDAGITKFNQGLDYKKGKDVADDVSEMGKQISDTTAAVKTNLTSLLPIIRSAKAKYGEIPGTGLVADFVNKNRLTANYLQSPEAKDIRGKVEALGNILNRTDITGAAFGDKEAEELRRGFADLLSTENLEQSLSRLLTKVDAAVKKHVLTKRPEAQAIFFKRFPELTPDGYTPPAAPQAPALDTSTPVREPSGAVAPVPGGAPKKFFNAKLNKTKFVYPDGREEIVDGKR